MAGGVAILIYLYLLTPLFHLSPNSLRTALVIVLKGPQELPFKAYKRACSCL